MRNSFYIPSIPPGAFSYVVSNLVDSSSGGLVCVIVKDEARAVECAQQLSFFASRIPVSVFPGWDNSLYEALSPSIEVIGQRIRVLSSLAQKDTAAIVSQVVFIPLDALMFKVPGPSFWEQNRRALHVGSTIPYENVLKQLHAFGYERVDAVHHPGEYAVRGGILDVFSLAHEGPVRLEFFGDEIESISYFDPLTQKRSEVMQSCYLVPAREYLLSSETVEVFKERCKAWFADSGEWHPFLLKLEEGMAWPGIECALPLLHQEVVCILDLLQPSLIIGEGDVTAQLAALLEKAVKNYKARRDIPTHEAAILVVEPKHLLVDSALLEGLSEADFVEIFSFALSHHKKAKLFERGEAITPFIDLIRRDRNEHRFSRLATALQEAVALQKDVLIAVYGDAARERILYLLRDQGMSGCVPVEGFADLKQLRGKSVGIAVVEIPFGFKSQSLWVVTEQDIFGSRISRAPRKRRQAEAFLREMASLNEGDFVVHAEHGVARYEGLVTLEVTGVPHDCVKLVYQGEDRLFVPVENIEVLSRYSSGDAEVVLDKLGALAWQARKARVKKKIQEIADRLIKIAAERHVRQADTFPRGQGSYDEFCARFPYPETDDQLNAIEDVMEDLSTGKPMDRLICGDVGFGKTEVALRAAFVVAHSGKQVAVVVPTTLLCRQHYEVFKERFAPFGIEVAQLSRLKTRNESAAIHEELARGAIKIIVATHAIFAKNLEFADLGLLIIDEEHHFGVTQKEKLKQIKPDVHVLTLTATPIPRTLHMALSGVREMSIIATPPVDRLAVKTYVTAFDPLTVRDAILREKEREGQVFYVSPRIEDLGKISQTLEQLVPEVRFVVAHGKMAPLELEKKVSAFCEGEYDLLLSTSIIESGIDLPKANTLIVHRADLFGLAQLYQLRGRVGRSRVQGYAYLLLPHYELRSPAVKRLSVIQSLDTLGAGFTLASHDMDLRGAGNLVGEEQSGHIREVGVELYQSLLNEAIHARLSHQEAMHDQGWSPQINLGVPVMIPETYVADQSLRLGLYRRAGEMKEETEIEDFKAELKDRFGILPQEVVNFIEVLKLKCLCLKAGIEKIDAGPKGALLTFRKNTFAYPAGLIQLLQDSGGVLKLRPDHKLAVLRTWPSPQACGQGLLKICLRLSLLAQQKA